jgi:undecaprenyl-diphosphatase
MGAFVDLRSGTGNEMMRWVTDMGDYEFVLHTTVIVGLLVAVFGHIEISLGIISGIALTSYLTSEMKRYFHVARPDDFVVRAGGWSYPSGHTSGAFILAIMVTWVACVAIPNKFTRYCIITLASLYAVSVAISRMYLGVHWLSDVIGGMLLAASVGLLVMGILKPVIMKRKQVSN